MKRLSTFFTVLSLIALTIIGCSKDDGESDNNGNNSGNGTGNGNGNSNTSQTVAAITPDFLNGTWSHVEFEYDGVKFSNNANHQTEWNCVKKGSFVFTKNQVTLITNQYDNEDNTCTENRRRSMRLLLPVTRRIKISTRMPSTVTSARTSSTYTSTFFSCRYELSTSSNSFTNCTSSSIT